MFSLQDVSNFPDALITSVSIYDDASISLAHAAGLVGLVQQSFHVRYGHLAHKNPNPAVYKGYNNRPIKWCISIDNFLHVLEKEEWSADEVEKVRLQFSDVLGTFSLAGGDEDEDEVSLPARKRLQEKRVAPSGVPDPKGRATKRSNLGALSVKMDKLTELVTHKLDQVQMERDVEFLHQQLQHRPDFKAAWDAHLERLETEERARLRRELISQCGAAWRADVEREFKQGLRAQQNQKNHLREQSNQAWVQALLSSLK